MPNVSPGKTIEGYLGGAFTAVVVVIIVATIYEWNSDRIMMITGLTLLISSVSVVGDLNESMLKRETGLKDSGSILPGHGGVMDRIDSLTAATPIFALCFVFFGW